MSEPGEPESVGSAAEEAARLLGALSEWAREHGTDVAAGLGATLAGFAGQAATAARDLGHNLDEHLATGAPECAYCPVCRTVHVIREASPEVRAQVTSAAASLLQAAATVLAAAATPASGTRGRRAATVERIDLDADWPEGES
ncbi:hypothetical protein [Nocardioides sp.]|uniref:hypothetical protein n=1 Tax=Nocardioides sp. TaxID=35761 RepID=UPI0039E68311